MTRGMTTTVVPYTFNPGVQSSFYPWAAVNTDHPQKLEPLLPKNSEPKYLLGNVEHGAQIWHF